jgi:hypothetical protein
LNLRDEIASCCEAAYQSIAIKDATKLLFVNSLDEVHDVVGLVCALFPHDTTNEW